jgi:hypothetical protein
MASIVKVIWSAPTIAAPMRDEWEPKTEFLAMPDMRSHYVLAPDPIFTAEAVASFVAFVDPEHTSVVSLDRQRGPLDRLRCLICSYDAAVIAAAAAEELAVAWIVVFVVLARTYEVEQKIAQ